MLVIISSTDTKPFGEGGMFELGNTMQFLNTQINTQQSNPFTQVYLANDLMNGKAQ